MRRAVAAGLVGLATAAIALTTLEPVAAAGAPAAASTASTVSTASASADGGNGREARIADRALARAQSVLAGRAATGHDATLALRDLRVAYPHLSVGERQQADTLLDRPYVGQRVCNTDLCVHYGTGYGTLAQARATLSTMASVWAYEVGRLGYRAPATDGTAGGDSRFDVYLGDIGDQGLYGYCAPEAQVSGQPYRATSFCVLDDDFAEFPLPGDPSRRVTAAHEFFHAIQFNYDYLEDAWILEATAVWMEDQYADDVNDNRQYLSSGQLRRPGVPLDLFDQSLQNYYGNWVFFQRLSQTYGQSSVRSIWQLLDATTGAPDYYSVAGIARYLRTQGTRLRSFYADFAAGNLVPAAVYDEGAAYPAGSVARRMVLRKGRTKSAKVTLEHLTARSYSVRPGKALKRHWRLRIALDGPRRSSGAGAFVQVVYRDGTVERHRGRLNRRGDKVIRVDFSRSSVRRVLITVSNAGIKYRCGADQPYACSGSSKSDGKRWTVRVRATKGHGS